MLRNTTQLNHPTVKTLSFESEQESSSLPPLLQFAVSNEKIIICNVFWRKQQVSAISSLLLGRVFWNGALMGADMK